MPVVSGTQRTDAAQFHDHVGTFGNLDDATAPQLKDFSALAGVGADSKRRADMIQYDRHSRKRPRKFCKLSQLWMINPRVKAEMELFQPGKALAEFSIAKQPLRRFAAQRVARIPCGRVTN